jgi:hypothetical protein
MSKSDQNDNLDSINNKNDEDIQRSQFKLI